MTDEVAIVTKAKENIMFAMATLSMEDREKLSTTKRELVQKCSFNGKACDIEGDFLTHIDPVFGSCFTFNHNRTVSIDYQTVTTQQQGTAQCGPQGWVVISQDVLKKLLSTP
ncbi:hypothetical protein ANCCAN_00283 [Ancylostoma caninum]|uniref:Uncharacterized protein n=1 Tax=Ancylostoma caninum TaxID=29170 RepID=A0A368HDT1_ANCCA|nr:hypothetical protein ANCCAN_00283 [Ancylostoma caninum]